MNASVDRVFYYHADATHSEWSHYSPASSRSSIQRHLPHWRRLEEHAESSD